MRTIIIKQDTDLQALSSRLIVSNTAASQTDSALKQLQDLNPHVDINHIAAGTVLLVPEAPNFNASASDPVGGGTFDDFQQFVRGALSDAAGRLKSGNAARAADRAAITALTKTAAFKRILDSDAALKQQVADATSSFKDEQTQADADEKTVAGVAAAALATLAGLNGILG